MALPRPDETSLVGFNDMLFAELIDPAPTTVRRPIAENGRIAFDRLPELLNETEAETLTRQPVELAVRRPVARLQEEVSA